MFRRRSRSGMWAEFWCVLERGVSKLSIMATMVGMGVNCDGCGYGGAIGVQEGKQVGCWLGSGL